MYYDDHTEAKLGKVKDPVVRVVKWIKSRSPREKSIMGCLGGLLVGSHPISLCAGACIRLFKGPSWQLDFAGSPAVVEGSTVPRGGGGA